MKYSTVLFGITNAATRTKLPTNSPIKKIPKKRVCDSPPPILFSDILNASSIVPVFMCFVSLLLTSGRFNQVGYYKPITLSKYVKG